MKFQDIFTRPKEIVLDLSDGEDWYVYISILGNSFSGLSFSWNDYAYKLGNHADSDQNGDRQCHIQ